MVVISKDMRMKFFAAILSGLLCPFSATAHAEILHESATMFVALRDEPKNRANHPTMIVIKASDDAQAHLLLSCTDRMHLRAGILLSGLKITEPKPSIVLRYHTDNKEEKRVHGMMFPDGDKLTLFNIDPVNMRAVQKTNTPFFRDIYGHSRLNTNLILGEWQIRHSFELDEVNPWALKLAKRCSRDLSFRH